MSLTIKFSDSRQVYATARKFLFSNSANKCKPFIFKVYFVCEKSTFVAIYSTDMK